jgi:hypothetical protein
MHLTRREKKLMSENRDRDRTDNSVKICWTSRDIKFLGKVADAIRGQRLGDSAKEARIAALNEEMDGIHFVNSLYWEAAKR